MDHLTVVSDGDAPNGGDSTATAATTTKAKRSPSIPRTARPLPTDRMKFDKQEEALRAYVTATNGGKDAAGAAAIATRIGLIEATAALVNSFFQEAGLVERVSRGLYRPTEAVVRYWREYSLDHARARKHLGDPLRGSWYFQSIQPDLATGKVSEETIIRVLAEAAGADGERRPQLELVLDWLAYAGLITRKDGFVELIANPETPSATAGSETIPTPPAAAAIPKPTATPGTPQPSSQVMAFSFSVSLTVDDIAKLDPEQIKALFQAAGTMAAVKGALTE